MEVWFLCLGWSKINGKSITLRFSDGNKASPTLGLSHGGHHRGFLWGKSQRDVEEDVEVLGKRTEDKGLYLCSWCWKWRKEMLSPHIPRQSSGVTSQHCTEFCVHPIARSLTVVKMLVLDTWDDVSINWAVWVGVAIGSDIQPWLRIHSHGPFVAWALYTCENLLCTLCSVHHHKTAGVYLVCLRLLQLGLMIKRSYVHSVPLCLLFREEQKTTSWQKPPCSWLPGAGGKRGLNLFWKYDLPFSFFCA